METCKCNETLTTEDCDAIMIQIFQYTNLGKAIHLVKHIMKISNEKYQKYLEKRLDILEKLKKDMENEFPKHLQFVFENRSKGKTKQDCITIVASTFTQQITAWMNCFLMYNPFLDFIAHGLKCHNCYSKEKDDPDCSKCKEQKMALWHEISNVFVGLLNKETQTEE